ncbi:MAG: Asp-tRNA(Asn)/Glu-tRNA(Gln) amidotransferase subunit GatB [candidate division WOR-3 bacterium]
MRYEPVIGLEVHIQLKTKTKLFCSCPVKFGSQPNTNVCPICLGLPGVLPTMNEKAVELAIKAGLALNCQIADFCSFARKHYFYPDLPKGYQITQYTEPIAYNGFLLVNGQKISIRRLHLEEDSGKSIHTGQETLVDFNRCGVPLIEIVTEPEIHSPEQAVAYLETLRQIMRYLDVSDCDMEKGHFRCEPNISLRPVGQTQYGVRTELKNLNSLNSVYLALEFEIKRQTQILENNGQVIQETLYWDEEQKVAGPMRGKEESEDYRYFPEPDLPILAIKPEKIEAIRKTIPLLPAQRKRILVEEYNLPEHIAEIIVETKELADYFEQTIKSCHNYKLVANWLVTEVKAVLKEKAISIKDFRITPNDLADLLNMINDKQISGPVAKEIFAEMVETHKTAKEIVNAKNLFLIEDKELIDKIIDEVLSENTELVSKYKSGKVNVISFLIGLVVKKTQGKFSPTLIKERLTEKLNKK